MNKKTLWIVLGIILLLILVVIIYYILTPSTGNLPPMTTETLFEQIRNSINQHLAS